LLGRISEPDVELLVSGRAPRDGDHDLAELAAFVSTLRAAVPAEPDPEVEATLVRRVAREAGSTADAVARADTAPLPAARSPRWRPRLMLAAKVAVAAILVPAAMAALAFAGVRLPEPAREAFDRVGVELPNQSEDESGATGESDRGDDAERGSSSGDKGDGADAPSASGGGATTTPEHDGGNGGGSSGAGAGGPGGGNDGGTDASQGTGPESLPPGQGGVPPGQGGVPPGLGEEPPGHGGPIPGQGGGPQRIEPQAGGPPGGIPPGQAKPPKPDKPK
jgi:hypothetical protein